MPAQKVGEVSMQLLTRHLGWSTEAGVGPDMVSTEKAQMDMPTNYGIWWFTRNS
jgi:hypothetical protein